MKRTICMLLVLLVTFGLGACGVQTKTAQKEQQKKESEEMMAANFKMKDLSGNIVQLSDFKGKNVYIKYWASWCPICLGGLEEINQLSMEKKDFEVLTIVAPGYQGEKDVKAFQKWFAGVEDTEHISVLLDEDGSYTKQAGVRGYPTSQWIGKDGNILRMTPGQVDNAAIAENF